MRAALLTICSCFGLGLGLTATVPTANACSCPVPSDWPIQRDAIEGDADPAGEQAFWPEQGEAFAIDAEVHVTLYGPDPAPNAAPDVTLILKKVQ